jgi:hypothetical protein
MVASLSSTDPSSEGNVAGGRKNGGAEELELQRRYLKTELLTELTSGRFGRRLAAIDEPRWQLPECPVVKRGPIAQRQRGTHGGAKKDSAAPVIDVVRRHHDGVERGPRRDVVGKRGAVFPVGGRDQIQASNI